MNDKIILITFIVVVGVNSTVVENSSEANITMCLVYPEIKCAPSTLTDVLLFILSLLALICSATRLYSKYLSSDCKFRFTGMSRENNNRKVDDISVDLKFGEGEGIDFLIPKHKVPTHTATPLKIEIPESDPTLRYPIPDPSWRIWSIDAENFTSPKSRKRKVVSKFGPFSFPIFDCSLISNVQKSSPVCNFLKQVARKFNMAAKMAGMDRIKAITYSGSPDLIHLWGLLYAKPLWSRQV
ncbi:unnamed protein product [Bemisia tabaci]|uniref:Uncharacterized protein n=1 Tax=Bemisia tabaci TaxID=7038 RepID=A0A9P0F0N6_BEMTA|nr:unnamed protein product [Bemisia tabaci]